MATPRAAYNPCVPAIGGTAMTRIVSAAGAAVAALHVSCAATVHAPSPGAIKVINGATFVCDRDSCRLMNGGPEAQPAQGVLFSP